MTKVFLLGECMVELRAVGPNMMEQSFAGDTYNTAVYLKRCFNSIDTSYVTAIGTEAFSDEMLSTFAEEDINCHLVFRDTLHIPGLYSIQTDSTGERSFTYWRENSAARHIVNFLDDDALNTMAAGDLFFFSGISLGVICPNDRESFWHKLEHLKGMGVKIVFDPNYRPRMWQGVEEAQQAFAKAYALSEMMLPGIDDFESLYGINTVEGIIEYCNDYDIDELVIKNGSGSVVTLHNNDKQEHVITPVNNVVDTTSAGDAFNGAYLGARLSNYTIKEAVSLGAKAAGFVIQHRGAIVPKVAFNQFFNP